MHILLVSGPFDFIVSQRPKNILQWTTYIFYRGKWGKFSTQIVCQIPAKLTSTACISMRFASIVKMKMPISKLGCILRILISWGKIHVFCVLEFGFKDGLVAILILLVYFPRWQIKDYEAKIEWILKIPKQELVLLSLSLS